MIFVGHADRNMCVSAGIILVLAEYAMNTSTIKSTGFRKKSGAFLTFQPKMEVPKPSIGVSLGLCATCTKEKTELF